MTIEKLRPTYTFTQERLAALQAVVPEAFADGRINWEHLRAALGDYLEEEGADAEHFGLSWPGKRAARRLAATPSHGTLIPAPGQGIDEATTRNLFLEGDNLEVLKLLQKSYAGRVKLIYIDPPYNTGNDFIYKDDFSEPLASYLRRTGQTGEEGELLTTNPKAGGRFHSNWLNMMYPRLLLARTLLSDEGAIFISVDDNEIYNLRNLLSELFGEENIIATLVWQKSKKGDTKLISVIHEYVVVAVKNKEKLIESGVWRVKKAGVDEVLSQYERFKEKLMPDHSKIAQAMRDWYSSLPKNDIYRTHEHYRWSDDRGLYFADNFAGPDDGRKSRPRYDIFHPVTGNACKKPSTGWRWEEERTKQALAMNPPLIHFGPDETTIPCRKSYLKEIDSEPFASVFYRDGRTGTLEVEKLIGKGLFDFPKDVETLKSFLRLVGKDDAIVVDFFAGSCTTAHAVLEQNNEDGGNRRFILVQLPEPTNNPQFPTIADIGKERIRRVIGRMKQEEAGKLLSERETPADLGFKVFTLGRSHFKAWSAEAAQAQAEASGALPTLFDAAESPLVDNWQPDDLLVEILLQEGFPLDSRITVLEFYQQNWVWQVESEACAHRLFVCLDERLHAATIAGAARISNGLFICLDTALSDEEKLRLADQCRLKVI